MGLRRLVDRLQCSALTTLVGPAGVGKTRLALGAAMLAAVQESVLVGAAVASCLGLPRTGGRPYGEAILAWRAGRRLLRCSTTAQQRRRAPSGCRRATA